MKRSVKKGIKRVIVFGISALLLCGFLVLIADRAVERRAGDFLYDHAADIPECDAALVLGTAQYLQGGMPNPYFRYRIEAAAELYRAGRVKYLIVSGDNSRTNYNEPQDMKNALVKAGVPQEVVYLDYAGFRTLDSVVRMDQIFSQRRFVVVSQPFHNKRAVYIARGKGLEAYGFNARRVEGSFGLKVQVREKLARVKVFLDILTGKQPKFLGEKVLVGHAADPDTKMNKQ